MQGNVVGNVVGNTNGIHTGAVIGNVTGDTTGTHTGAVVGNVTGNSGTVTNGVYTSSSINALSDIDTVSVAPSNGQTLVWNGTAWAPGLPTAGGLDFGSFSAPAGFIFDLGTF